MTPQDFEFISTLLKGRSGLVLTQDKSYLLESRLMPVARKHGLKDLTDLFRHIQTSRDEALIVEVTEAMTTNESFFFRDQKPFDLLRDEVLPKVMANRAATRTIRIWCAAASSGQEPYSIAMTLKELGPKVAGWKFEILGTDISRDILAKAESATYSQFEVQRGLPITHLVKYFDKDGEQWRIKPEIRNMVTYKYYNLLDPLLSLGTFDIVFCRNVLIYFDPPTKGKVLDEIAKLMPADGMLFLGGAETVLGITERFRPIQGQRGVYERSPV